jgi:septal ring factor EnvC (AmiA/AmiB activator)
MSIFAKKPEWEQRVMEDVGNAPQIVAKGGGYGIAEAIHLLRGLPADPSNDLVVRVVGATLASVDVRLHDIIDDATKRQKTTHERIAAVHAQIGELERQLEAQRREVAALEADLKETTSVKERLQHAEKTSALAAGRTGPRPTTAAVADSLRTEQTPGPQVTPRPE